MWWVLVLKKQDVGVDNFYKVFPLISRVLYLVLAGNFALTIGFYWSYTFLL